MIICVSFYNVPHHFIATLRVNAIIGACSEIYQHACESAEQSKVTRRGK